MTKQKIGEVPATFFCLMLVVAFCGCHNYGLYDKMANPGGDDSHEDAGGSSTPAVPCTTNCRIFVTANAHDGNLGGITGADGLCMSDSNRPDNNTYKALLADDAATRQACSSGNCTSPIDNIDWVLKGGTTYFRASDGLPIFTTNSAGIYILGTPATNGISLGGEQVWTGLNPNWVMSGSFTCNSWTSNGSDEGSYGKGSATNSDMIGFDFAVCSSATTLHLYCVEQ